MARKPNVFPSYLLHQPTGQARVRINGQDHYLGEYGSEESRIRYGELIAKLGGGVKIDPVADSKRGRLPRNESHDPGPSVGELCLVFLRHAEGHYLKDGTPTSEIHIIRSVIKPLNALCGMLPTKDFGPLALKAVRQKMIESGWCRGTINQAMSRIRRIFKHAIANELIDSSVHDRLKCVAPLLAARTEAHDKPVATSLSATFKELDSAPCPETGNPTGASTDPVGALVCQLIEICISVRVRRQKSRRIITESCAKAFTQQAASAACRSLSGSLRWLRIAFSGWNQRIEFREFAKDREISVLPHVVEVGVALDDRLFQCFDCFVEKPRLTSVQAHCRRTQAARIVGL
jgi:hypothetical protein